MIGKILVRPACSILRTNARLIATEANNYILAEDVGDKGILKFNRPQAMNASNLEMVEKVLSTVQKWSAAKSLIVVKGTPGKVFSSGGDMKSIIAIKDNPEHGSSFWKKVLVTNYTIANMKIPYVAFIDGITMGGGVGLSVYAKYCIATENTLLAMPESAIGNIKQIKLLKILN